MIVKRERPQHGPAGLFAAVYALVRRIPRGKVATYGQIARLLGAPRHARVVGWAMHGNSHGAKVPCHRVIQQGGTLSPNYCPDDPGRQRRLLEREGVAFLLDGRVDLAVSQWQPDAVQSSSTRKQAADRRKGTARAQDEPVTKTKSRGSRTENREP